MRRKFESIFEAAIPQYERDPGQRRIVEAYPDATQAVGIGKGGADTKDSRFRRTLRFRYRRSPQLPPGCIAHDGKNSDLTQPREQADHGTERHLTIRA